MAVFPVFYCFHKQVIPGFEAVTRRNERELGVGSHFLVSTRYLNELRYLVDTRRLGLFIVGVGTMNGIVVRSGLKIVYVSTLSEIFRDDSATLRLNKSRKVAE